MENEALHSLNELYGKIESLGEENKGLREKISDNEKISESKSKEWSEELASLQKKVKDGIISVGNEVENYVIGNYSFSPYNWDIFREECKKLNDLLKYLSETRSFWHYKEEFVPRAQVYTFFSLKEKPFTYMLTPSQITLNSCSSFSIRSEPVFNEDAIWAFFERKTQRTIKVRPEKATGDYNDIILTERSCDAAKLEKSLEKNPIALKGFKEMLGLPIDEALKVRVKEYTNKAALSAINAIKKEYANVRENDRKIQEIEKKYNSLQATTEMFATRPVVPDFEPDPVLAKIMSYDSRTERNRALKSLAKCMLDLKRTGLIGYDKNIEVPVRVGEKKVYNLAEYSKYIGDILELSLEARETAKAE